MVFKRADGNTSFTAGLGGKVASGRVVARSSSAVRRNPDAATSKMFSNIHSNKERFSVASVNHAFAKARASKVG